MPELWNDLSDEVLLARYAWPRGRWIRLNMVVATDGQAAGHDGTSHTITSDHDRHLLRSVRNQADVVVLGAASVRAEGWFMPTRGDLVIVTRSPNLPDGCPDPQRARVAQLDDLASVVREYDHVLFEGGATVASTMIATGMIDELLLTFKTSVSRAVALPDWLTATAHTWSCVSDIADESHRFTIWRRGEG
jgi:riboflavin biosynthesis pyrimidine reductase